MRFLKRLLIGLVIVIAVLVGGAYLLPREITVERTVQIGAPAEAIFPHINTLKATENWSPWLDRDPNIEVSYSGPESGVGSKMTWASEVQSVGSGTQEIVESMENERITTALDFGDMGTATAWFILSEEGNATNVTWGLVTDMGNSPMGRYMGLMMDSWVGADYEDGLGRLKALVEAG